MKFYIKHDLPEGFIAPDAWIWHGKILPFSKNAPVGWALRIRLPWWVREYSPWLCTECLHQLVFGVSQFVGPEKYEFWFVPVGGNDV